MNLCRECEQDFGSVDAFDKHRVGSHVGRRRCLTHLELIGRGFTLNKYGRWTTSELAHGEELKAA